MEGVQFEENDELIKKVQRVPPPSGLIGKLITSGLAKDAQQANLILLGVGVAALLLTGIVLFVVGSGPSAAPAAVDIATPAEGQVNP